MNKKLIIVLLIGAFLMALVYAQGTILREDRTLNIDSHNRTILEDNNVLPYFHNDDYGNGDTHKRCLISNTTFKLPCSDDEDFISYTMDCNLWNVSLVVNEQIVYENQTGLTDKNIPANAVNVDCIGLIRVNKTGEEKKEELLNWEIETMKTIANNIEIRNKPVVVDIIREGEVS